MPRLRGFGLINFLAESQGFFKRNVTQGNEVLPPNDRATNRAIVNKHVDVGSDDGYSVVLFGGLII